MGLSATKLNAMDNKFVPQYHHYENAATECDTFQSSVVNCLEEADRSGKSCNVEFSKWNQCLAKECGYVQKESK